MSEAIHLVYAVGTGEVIQIKFLVVYDSNFGNTKIIAEIIAKRFGKEAKAISVSDFKVTDMKGLKFLIAGSPIIGWRPSEKMEVFLESLGKDVLKGVKVTSFDTRVNIFIHGDAAKQINQRLTAAGGELFSPPRAFFVKGKSGPLLEGEKEKAAEWADRLYSNRGEI